MAADDGDGLRVRVFRGAAGHRDEVVRRAGIHVQLTGTARRGTGLARNAGPVSRFAMRHVLPVMTFTPFATSRSAAGRHLADVVLGTTKAPTGSYVDRSRVARSVAGVLRPPART